MLLAAAYAAALITHADAIKIAYVRGLSSAEVTLPGAMLAAGLSGDEASHYLSLVPHESAVVACINSPSSVTLSGDVDSINKLEELISADGKFARKLKVKTAYHSPHMRTVSQSYFARMGQLSNQELAGDSRSNKALMFSSLKGRVIESPSELDAQYWVSNMENTVQFSAAVSSLLKHSSQPGKKTPTRWGGFVEIGPHTALKGPVQQIISANSTIKAVKEAPYLSLIERGKDAIDTSLGAAGQLWTYGHTVDLDIVNTGIHSGEALVTHKALANLPSYPWNHSKRFWHESYLMRSNRFPASPRTDLLGVPEDLSSSLEPRWRNHLRLTENPWIEDHKITGTILYPAAGMLVMALEGALQTINESSRSQLKGFRFHDVRFDRGLVVPSGEEAVETRLSLSPHSTVPGEFGFAVLSTTTGMSWVKHCFGTISLVYTTEQSEIEDASSEDVEWQQWSAEYESITGNGEGDSVDVDGFYDHLDAIGMEYGPLFRNVTELVGVPDLRAAYAKIALPDTLSSMPASFEFPHVMHPATMDSIFHLLLATLNNGRPVTEAAVPYGIDHMFVAYDQPHGAGEIFAGFGKLVNQSNDGHEIVGDLVISDEAWSGPKMVITGFTLRQVTSTEGSDSSAVVRGNESSKCAEIVWTPDTDLLEDYNSHPEGMSPFSMWLNCAVHKRPIGTVLVIVDHELSPDAAQIVQGLWNNVGFTPGISDIAVTGRSAKAVEQIRSLVPIPESATYLWEFEDTPELPTSQASFDAIIVPSSLSQIPGTALKNLHGSLSTHGCLVALGNVSSQKSQDSLTSAGFVDLVLGPRFVVASVSTSPSASLPTEVYILRPDSSSNESPLEGALKKILEPSTIVHTTHISSAPSLAGKHVISLIEAESPFIYSWGDEGFNSFKTLISSAAHVFWITRGGLLDSWANGVEFSPAQGLLRVLRNEYPLVTLPHIDLSVKFNATNTENADAILSVWKTTLLPGAELEFAEHDGIIYIPRAVSHTVCDNDIQMSSGRAKPIERTLSACSTPMKPTSVIPGGGFLWTEDGDATKPLSPQEVEVKVQLISLGGNHAHQKPDNLGREAVGIITRCGSDVRSVVTGQQVALFHQECFQTHLRVAEGLVASIPSGWEGEQAAAAAGVFVQAQYALLEIAGLQREQTVLIHSAASSLGQAAIQIAQMVGAQIFAMADTRADKELLMERYSIPSGCIFDSARETFVGSIKKATKGLGLQVILSPQASPAVRPSISTLGKSGFFLDCCHGDNTSHQDIRLPASSRNASLVRIDMDHIGQFKQQLTSSLFQRTFNTFARHGLIKPIAPVPLFSVNKVAEALTTLNDPKNNHTVVVSFDDNATILVPPPPAPKLKLDSNATYILAGGLGALGLNIAHMMVEAGAGHLVFLSRSGGVKNITDLESLRRSGARIDALKCNVNDAVSVANVFAKLRDMGCVIRGLLQAAMVLEDGIFDNMTHEKWFRAFEPKTRGSRNLLEHLSSAAKASSSPSPPFFLLLSSITGVIGNTAQANYASGNTFEDALAQHARTHLGIPATSIDIGLVSDSSHFTSEGEFGELENYLHRYSHGWEGLQNTMEELRITMAGLMRRAEREEVKTGSAQIVLGLSDGLVKRQGKSGFQHDRKFALRVIEEGGSTGGDGKNVGIADLLKQAESLADAATVIEDDLKAQIADAIGVAVGEIDGQKPLFDFGGML